MEITTPHVMNVIHMGIMRIEIFVSPSSLLLCLYEHEPHMNRKVATTVHIAGIPNRTDHSFIYGSVIHPTIGKRIIPKPPATCHGVGISICCFRKDSEDVI